MQWILEQLFFIGRLDYLTGVNNRYSVRNFFNDGKIMRNEQNSHCELIFQLYEQL